MSLTFECFLLQLLLVITNYILQDSCRELAFFQQAKKLHLTIVMLSLLDDDDMQLATECLERVVSDNVR